MESLATCKVYIYVDGIKYTDGQKKRYILNLLRITKKVKIVTAVKRVQLVLVIHDKILL